MLIKSTTGKVLTDTQGRMMTTKDRWHPLVVGYAQRVVADGGKIETPALEEMNTMAWNGDFDDALFAYFACGYKAGKAYTLIGDDLIVERDSATTRWNKYGILEEIGEDVPEMALDPLTHEFKGLSVRNQRTLLNPNLTDFPYGEEITFSHEENIIGSEVPIRFYDFTNTVEATLSSGNYNWLVVTTNPNEYYSFSFIVHKGSSRYYHIRCSGTGQVDFIFDSQEDVITDEQPTAGVGSYSFDFEKITNELYLINITVLRNDLGNDGAANSLRVGAVQNPTGLSPLQPVLPDTIGLSIASHYRDNQGLYPIVLSDDGMKTRLADDIFLESATALIGQNSGAVGFICDFASPTEVHFMGENLTVTDDFLLFEYSPTFVKYFKNKDLISQKNGTFDFSGMDRIDLGSYEQTSYLNGRIKLIYLK